MWKIIFVFLFNLDAGWRPAVNTREIFGPNNTELYSTNKWGGAIICINLAFFFYFGWYFKNVFANWNPPKRPWLTCYTYDCWWLVTAQWSGYCSFISTSLLYFYITHPTHLVQNSGKQTSNCSWKTLQTLLIGLIGLFIVASLSFS